MKVLSVPARLRLSVVLVVLCVPLAALQAVLYFRAPWWNLPYGPMTAASLAAVAVFAPLGALMAHGWRMAWRLSAILAFAWVAGAAWVSVSDRNFWLGLSVILLAAFWIALLAWVRSEMGRSFYDPKMSWFEGRPQPIPGLSCEYVTGEGKLSVRVSRLDRDGLFVFRPKGTVLPMQGRGAAASNLELTLEFRGRRVNCTARPMRLLPGGTGAGLKFCDNPPDRLKELGDFVELLRGEGYVG